MDVSGMTEVFGHRNGDGSGYREKRKKKEPSFKSGRELVLYLISQGVSLHVLHLLQDRD